MGRVDMQKDDEVWAAIAALLDDYDPSPGLVARGAMSDAHDPDSCDAACCREEWKS